MSRITVKDGLNNILSVVYVPEILAVVDDTGTVVARDETSLDEGKKISRVKKLNNVLADTVDYPDMGNWWNARLISGGFHVGEKGDTLQENATTLTYQLASPIVTQFPAQILTGGANHTVYWLPEIADAGIYDNGITVLNQDLPIKSLKKVSKIDFGTGAETALNVATAVIAGDKKSFTHPDLTDDDIVFFEYEYDSALSTAGELTIGYLDSRYVVKGADDNYYTWKVAVDAEGKASIVAEVVA